MHANEDLLAIYLNDHLAGATVGVELARRIARSPWPSPDGETIAALADEIESDCVALREMMATLRVPVRMYKVCAAWAAEKAGRVKLNGRLRSRSPLSAVVELEGLMVAVPGKAAGWRTLRRLAERDARLNAGRLDELLRRADRQVETLEALHARTVTEVFGPP